jgi:hypothetical protein
MTASKQVAYMKSWSLALTLMAVLLLAAVLLFVVRPPVYAVQKNKDGTQRHHCRPDYISRTQASISGK